MARPPARAALANVMVENADAFHCGVCSLPLKPPIFLCDQGNFMCSSCSVELEITGRCRRCEAAEKLVESIRVPCPNAAYGCDATPAYYDHGEHLVRCPHRPCRCPGESCGFAGGMASLLDHFTTVHGWPLDNLTDSVWAEIYLQDGCNLLDAVGDRYLIVLTVSRERLGRAISVTCVDNGAYPSFKLKLEFSRYREADRGSDLHRSHRRGIIFSGLYDGLRDPDDCFHVVVPRSFYPDETESL